jgi:uncharacterized protein YecE (DUF72 family)
MITIGTCGYGRFQPGGDWRSRYADKLQAYADHFPTVELNRTFYKLPMIKTARKWREEVPPAFDFTVKAWQAVTHPTSSVTWRKRTDQLTDEQMEGFGNLRPNDVTMDAWSAVMDVAEVLEASVCLVQASASFGPSEENVDNLRRFFTAVERRGIEVAWEPRGEWNDHLDLVEELCEELDLVHVVDPFRRAPRSQRATAYLRLHGRNPKETDYNYAYSEDELCELAEMLRDFDASHDRVYCMFNNYEMYDNAATLQRILAEA